MKIGGWHRLWIVASTTYFVLVSAFVFLNWVQPEGLPHIPDFYEQLAPESISKIVPSSKLDEIDSREGVLRVKMPNAHVIPFYSEYSQDELEKVTDEYWSVVKKKAIQERTKLMLNAFLWWIIPCLVVYILGWSVRWIYRGFKAT